MVTAQDRAQLGGSPWGGHSGGGGGGHSGGGHCGGGHSGGGGLSPHCRLLLAVSSREGGRKSM